MVRGSVGRVRVARRYTLGTIRSLKSTRVNARRLARSLGSHTSAKITSAKTKGEKACGHIRLPRYAYMCSCPHIRVPR